MLLSSIICALAIIISCFFKAALINLALLFIFLICFFIFNGIYKKFIIAFILPLIVLISFILYLSNIENLKQLDSKKETCIFTIKEITYESEEFNIATARITESELLNKPTDISLFYYNDTFSVGDRVSGEIKYSELNEKYKLSRYSKNIFLSGSCYNYRILKGSENKILKNTQKLRNYITKTTFSNMEYEEASVTVALLFGEHKYFSAEFDNNVKRAGVSHVMVVSGMHLSILVMLLTFITNKLFYNRFLKAFIIIFTVFLLSLLCGFTMSILRAGVMYLIAALGIILNKPVCSENVLGATVTLILVFSPFAIFNVAFLLSVLSTFGILSVSAPICRYLRDRKIIENRLISSVLFSILTSLSATLLSLPVIIYVYGYVSIFGVIATLLITYPVTLVIWFCVIALILNPILPFVSKILYLICNMLLKYIIYVINYFADIPFATVPAGKYAFLISIITILFIFYLLFTCKKRIDMIKLKEIKDKISREGGVKLKWQ